MYVSLFLAVISIQSLFLPAPTPHAAAARSNPKALPAVSFPRSIRPQVVENGSDLVTLPLQPELNDYLQSNVAFGPDGTGYFIDASGAVEEVSPSGRYMSIPVSRALATGDNSIIYARGRLWMTADYGIVSVDPNGAARRFYALALHGEQFRAIGVASGNDGSIYTLANDFDAKQSVMNAWLYRIDAQGAVKGILLPHLATAAYDQGFFSGAGGDFYTVYNDYYGSGQQGIARIRFDGTQVLFPTGSGFSNTYQPVSPAYSRGNVYFLTSSVAYVNERDVYTWYLDRLNAAGITTLKTFASREVASEIAVDFGGNIWITTVVPPAAPALYQYNVSTGGYGGPFLSSASWSGPIAVGSDDNIWLPLSAIAMVGPTSYCCYFSGFSVFVRHVQTLEPASVTVTAVQTAAFTILETHANGPWTAITEEPTVATVTPAVSTNGTFAVREVHAGSAQILVMDKLGNVSYETVSAR